MPCTEKYLRQIECLFHFKIWNYYPTNFCLFLTSCFSLVGKRRQTVREKMRSCQGRVLHARTKTPNVFLISKAFPFWYGPIFVEKHKLQMHHKSGVFLQRHKKTQAVRANTFTYFYYININTKRSRREVRHWEHPQNVPVCPTILLGLVVSEL